MSEKAKSLEFQGIATGDGDCFCFEVDEATYRQVEGEQSHRIEAEYRQAEPMFADMPWRLYPMCGLTDSGKRYRVRLEVEEMP